MNNDKNKRENRKALRSFIPILLLMAVIGGIIGAFSTTGTAAFWTGSARVILREIMYVISPIGVIVMTLAGAVITLIYTEKGKKVLQRESERRRRRNRRSAAGKRRY